MKKWGIIILVVIVIVGLYFIEFSKINITTPDSVSTLDELTFNESGQNWDDFYRVRINIIDGQTAEFSIPKNLQKKINKELKLEGAAVFFGNGCKPVGDKIAVHSFFLYPTLGLANACEHLPEIAMRWTILVTLQNDWMISREDMIDACVRTTGTFRINTDKPYDSAFFLDNTSVELILAKEVQN